MEINKAIPKGISRFPHRQQQLPQDCPVHATLETLSPGFSTRFVTTTTTTISDACSGHHQ
jgi:hypothetical protein